MQEAGAERIELIRDGLTFRATARGPVDGSPVLLLHGFPGGLATWRRTVDALGDAPVRTIALEQRGYSAGARPSSVAAYRLPELARDVVALADRLQLDRVHVVGHDWGGMVAWYLGAHHRERVASLTVLSTPHPRAFATAAARSTQAVRSLYAVAFQLPVLPELTLTAGRGRVLRASLMSSGLDREMAEQYRRALGTATAMRSALHWYRAVFRHPGDARSVGTIEVPTTYVWSTRDAALGRAAADATARHVTAPYRFVVLEGVSHWIPETEPTKTAAEILSSIAAAAH